MNEAAEATATLPISDIARITHDANRTLCRILGDDSQVPWEYAEHWQKESAVNGVLGIVKGLVRSPEESHEAWLEHKKAGGWIYGPVKDAEARTHPCMVPYADLPTEQRLKDALFFGIVRAFTRGS